MKIDLNEAIDREENRIHQGLTELFSRLFWKDYAEGHITAEDKQNLIALLDDYVYQDYEDDSGYYKFKDEAKVYSIIKTIREKIGLEK